MTWKLVVFETGEPAEVGATYHNFRNEPHVLEGGRPPHKPNSSGHIWTDKGEFFPSVCGLKWMYVDA